MPCPGDALLKAAFIIKVTRLMFFLPSRQHWVALERRYKWAKKRRAARGARASLGWGPVRSRVLENHLLPRTRKGKGMLRAQSVRSVPCPFVSMRIKQHRFVRQPPAGVFGDAEIEISALF